MTRVYEKKRRPLEDFMEVVLELRSYEVTAQCPDCHTIETLELTKGHPLKFGKWRGVQDIFGVSFYHNGSEHPARVLRWS